MNQPLAQAIAARLTRVRERIDRACQRAGRASSEIELIAVSKLHPAEEIRAAYQAGARSFGENYPQELRDKSSQLSDLRGLRWHAIGPLQTNKAKYIARSAHAFHALDRVEVAQELSKRREGTPLVCLIEVNLAAEQSKAGVLEEGLADLLSQLRGLPGLEVRGLMCLPPPSDDPERSRPYFRKLAGLAREHRLPELSMGTTADFEIAIEEGATCVRVGTAIFGERPS